MQACDYLEDMYDASGRSKGGLVGVMLACCGVFGATSRAW